MVPPQIPHPDVSWPIFTAKLPLPETSDLLFAAVPLQVPSPAGINPLSSIWGQGQLSDTTPSPQ